MAEIPNDFHRRIGKFCISHFLVNNDPGSVVAALSGGIVVRCEYLYASGDLEYVMLHSAFDPVPIYEITPEYECFFRRHDDLSVTHEWRRVNAT